MIQAIGQIPATPPSWAVTPEKVDGAVSRIVRRWQPERVIIFGSYARGQADANSDLDVLVVMRGPVASPRKDSIRIREDLGDISMPMDILVVSRKRLEALERVPGLIYRDAVREGKVVYDARKD